MTFRVFGRKTCPYCQKAREKVEYFLNRWNVKAPVVYYDVDVPEGMAEGAWYDVYEIPTVLLEDEDQIVQRWLKTPPLLQELKKLFRISDTAGDDAPSEVAPA
jgi:thiol-disulfide isomerase/thioredoxin